MWKRLKPTRVNIEEFHAKITMDMILEFKRQIKFQSYTAEQMCDRRKLSDYNIQQLRDYVQKYIISL